MGWQLFPTGIGWREFSSSPGKGEFTCPNPRCTSAGAPTPYQHKAGRNWVTVLFVPVLPLNRTGEWVRCTRCKSLYPLHVIGPSSSPVDVTSAPDSPPPPPTPPLPPPWEPDVDASGSNQQPMSSTLGELPRSGSAGAMVLRFSDGSVLELLAPTVVGRDPTPIPDVAAASLHQVSDQTVSKTHLAVGRTGNEVWVFDNHSSNGVYVGPSLEGASRIPTGRRVILSPGSIVSIGDSTSFAVGWSEGPR